MSIFSSQITLSTHYPYINNIVELPYSDKERIIGYMHARFLENKMYTWAGNVLLYVRIYKKAHSKSGSILSSIMNEEEYVEYKTPSVKTVIDRLWFSLGNNIGKSDKTIVVLGESGSGKTYSSYLAIKSVSKKVANDPEGDRILRQVWASVPLLCAFGNASTNLNATSSRFGKLIRLHYANGSLSGGMIETYLLEKTRVASVPNGEGNFHIFRQILDSLDEDTLTSLTLSKLINYRIAPRVGLKSAFSETVKSMDLLHITEFNRILKVLAIILNLGNVKFIKNVKLDNANHGDGHVDKIIIVDPETNEFLENAASLMHVNPIQLIELLCTLQISSKGSKHSDIIYMSSCTNIQECQERRDCIMKHLYQRLFLWLVNTINLRIFFGDTKEHINILDFYGFENLNYNSFEQLCINYSNERLHDYFTREYLIKQREELIMDGYQVDNFDDVDYLERTTFLDGPKSIFQIIDDACYMKQFKKKMNLNKTLCQTFRLNKHFYATDQRENYFCIRHYAGVVKYDTKFIIMKNHDKIPYEILNFLKHCGFDFIKVLLQYDLLEYSNVKQPSVINYYKHYFDKLEVLFEEADVQFITCLKPNDFRIPEFFDEDYFSHQLYINGIFDIIKLSFQNYSIKIKHDIFIKEFGIVLFDLLKKPLSKQIHISQSNIFLTEAAYVVFRRFKQFHMNHAARILQKCWLSHSKKRHKAAKIIQNFARFHVLSKSGFYERFMDISKQSENLSLLNKFCARANTIRKIEQYLEKNRVEINFEGEPLSLRLEKIYEQLVTLNFKRYTFIGDNIITYINLHQDTPLGLTDAL